jgi:hypothetical protein
MKPNEQENEVEFSVENTKEEINQLLAKYRTRKDELEWVSDDWEEGEIQEELDGYARQIKVMKAQIKKYEQSLKESVV